MTLISRLLLTLFAFTSLTSTAFAQDAMSLDQKVNEAFASFTGRSLA